MKRINLWAIRTRHILFDYTMYKPQSFLFGKELLNSTMSQKYMT
jgi:hypothetical protein